MPRFLTVIRLLAAILASISLSACNSSSGTGTPTGPVTDGPYSGRELALGSYFIDDDWDDDLTFKQYFIVRPGGEWEFAEFGMDSKSELKQLTRQIGVYKIDSAMITLQITHTGELTGGATLTDAAIEKFPFKRTTAPSGAFAIEDIKETSFRGKGMFIGGNDWNTYYLKALPKELTAPSPLTRTFEPALLTVPDPIIMTAGVPYTLDLTGGRRSASVVMYYLAWRPDFSTDSSAMGKFTLQFERDGHYALNAWIRDVHGNILPETAIHAEIEVAGVAPVITAPETLSVRINKSRAVEASAIDAQGDLAEVTWDFGADGTIDFRSAQKGAPDHVFRKLGKDSIVITAKDKAGHVSRKAISVEVVNHAPVFTRTSIDTTIYIVDGFPVALDAFDYDSNLVDRAEWDFDRDGTIDTVTTLSGRPVLRFSEMKTYDGDVTIKDSLGLAVTQGWRIAVAGYRSLGRPEWFPSAVTLTAFKGKLWAHGASDQSGRGFIWSSPDGGIWTRAPGESTFPAWSKPLVAEFLGRLWALPGTTDSPKQQAWSSADGVAWAKETESAPAGTGIAVFQNRLWIFGSKNAGGTGTQVWSSADGKAWTLAGDRLPAGYSQRPTVVVFQGKLFALGTLSEGGTIHPAQVSADGITWTAADFPAPWLFGGLNTEMVVAKGALWLLGPGNNVWKSTDGVNWGQGPGGYFQRLAAFGDGIFLFEDWRTYFLPLP